MVELGAGIVIVASLCSLYFSLLTHSLRHGSRSKLGEYLEQHGKSDRLEPLMRQTGDLAAITAFLRLVANILVFIGVLVLVESSDQSLWAKYAIAGVAAAVITLFFSLIIPHAAVKYVSAAVVGSSTGFLGWMGVVLHPITRLARLIERLFARISGSNGQVEPDRIEQEIVSAAEVAQKEGVMDEEEREMIESVIEFHDIHVGQIMTARPEIVALDQRSTLERVKQTIEQSGHSRLPVYDGTLDKIVGVLYARDLIKHLGMPADQFDIHTAMRPALYVPETKLLRDLLNDFRVQKVHIAIVMDEYGGTAGLVTIEDLLEELVGDISDEHEPAEPAMLKRIDDHTWEADARAYVDEINRLVGLDLPEDAGYDTLGGFITTMLGRIPSQGTTFGHLGVHYTVLDAEPRKVNRIKIELTPQPAEPQAAGNGQ